MARPFDSIDSPLMRQQPFSQYGGAPTRETGVHHFHRLLAELTG